MAMCPRRKKPSDFKLMHGVGRADCGIFMSIYRYICGGTKKNESRLHDENRTPNVRKRSGMFASQ